MLVLLKGFKQDIGVGCFFQVSGPHGIPVLIVGITTGSQVIIDDWNASQEIAIGFGLNGAEALNCFFVRVALLVSLSLQAM